VTFRDRVDAGRQLAARLQAMPEIAGAAPGTLVVLGLPRGGVPVAYEVATALGAPLDVILVRKVGVPRQPELAMGAVGEHGARVVNQQVVDAARITNDQFAAVEARERAELERRAEHLRGTRAHVALGGTTALIVDDGIATGATARAACEVARAQGAARIVLAAPVAPPSTIRAMREVADDVVVVEAPERFFAIGEFYSDFSATTDDAVLTLLSRRGRT
jgi:putative phosphoribosyl transferase